MPWLATFILRLMMGERFHKATPTQLRVYSGGFAILPIWMWLFVHLGHSILQHASAIGIFGYMMAFMVGTILFLAVWAKYVSSDISWWLGGVVWVVALWLIFTGRFINVA